MDSSTNLPVSPAPDARPGQILGDFHLLREIGQGGMGVVYEAVQLSLGRHVAVKILPFAAALDSRRLQRFKIEAQAAALLHHAHIVPVHAVGCEHGVHFYAMQLVHGATLAEVIHRIHDSGGVDAGGRTGGLTGPYLPDAVSGSSRSTLADMPTPGRGPDFYRAVARVGIQAADALDHAHANGVIHRDIKPANLMLQSDGHLWVTDFGLAQLADDVHLTRTGDLIGTLRYMSPEQVLARRVPIDHRTDIYSLGVTLYELLAGRPAFTGADRQELLRQVAFEEPAAPRRLDRAIPIELETIVLKALAKNPAERYGSAAELADDLRAFVEDRPIRARRPSLVERLGRWGRRHRGLVVGGVTVLLVAVVALALSTWLIWQQKEETRVERDRATEEEARAVESARRAQSKEEEAQQALGREAAQRRRAEQLLGLGLKTLDEMFVGAAAYRLMRGQPTSDEDRQQMRQAVNFLELFTKQTTDDPAAQRQIARAYGRLADLQVRLGAYDRAVAAAYRAIDLVERLSAQRPDDLDLATEVGVKIGQLGVIHDLAGKPDEAEKVHQQALLVQRKLAARHPERRRLRGDVAATLHNLAMIRLDRGDFPAVVRLIREAIVFQRGALRDIREQPSAYEHYFNHCSLLGSALLRLKDHDEALRVIQEGHRVALGLADQRPGEVRGWEIMARSYANLGEALRHIRLAEAEVPTRRGLDMRERLVQNFPGVPRYAENLTRSCLSLGMLLQQQGRLDEAERLYRNGAGLLEKLVEQFPDLVRYRTQFAAQLERLVQLLCRRDRPTEAHEADLHDLAVLTRLAEEHPGWREIRLQLGKNLGSVGQRLLDQGERGEAICMFLSACQVLERLARGSADVEPRFNLAGCFSDLGRCCRDLEQFGEAQEAFTRAERLFRPLCSAQPANKEYPSSLAQVLNERGLAYHLTGAQAQAEEMFNESIALLEKLRRDGDSDPLVRRRLGGTLHNLARLEMDRKGFARAQKLLDRAIQEQHAAIRAVPDDRSALEFLSNHHIILIELLTTQGRSAEAATACERFIDDFKNRESFFGSRSDYLRHVARWRSNQGIQLWRAKQVDDAGKALQAAVDAYEQLGSKDPGERSNLARVLHVLSGVRAGQKRPEAVALLRGAIREQLAAVRARPHETKYRGMLRQHCTELARALLATKDVTAVVGVAANLAGVLPPSHEDALQAARLLARCLPLAGKESAALQQQIRKYVKQAVAHCPAEADARNNLAWELVMGAEKELWDPSGAVALARLAVAEKPNDGISWNTLGLALYRTRNLAEAVVAMQQSMRFRKGGDAHDWLILALIYQRRGDVKLARQWYERSLRWLKTQPEVSDDAQRLLSEAKAYIFSAPLLVPRSPAG